MRRCSRAPGSRSTSRLPRSSKPCSPLLSRPSRSWSPSTIRLRAVLSRRCATGSERANRPMNASAYLEAISHCTTGIELLKTLPETPERTQHALTLYITLGAALQDGERARSARGRARLYPGLRIVSAGG